ncbi:MAG: membrane protein DedA with SNARE-associated domain [Candidatus Deianiraeaceae bacterium]|jgi:membrane protein DedA with SNARE-associated domain
MESLISGISHYIVTLVEQFGYFGIILAMAMESSLFPLPSEIVMIPAGILVHQGKLNFFLVTFSGVLGSYLGSLANYLLADFLGRPLIIRYGQYIMLPKEKLYKIEVFFTKYGSISIFIGRLLPIVRHFISIPAGFAKMNIWLFTLYTILGSALWMFILTTIGYYLGDNMDKIHIAMPIIKLAILLFIVAFLFYFFCHIYRKQKKT